jgi:VWFA-related protein
MISALLVLTLAQASTPPPVFKGGTQEILLDFVARDKHHNVVKDLRPDDIEIYEDGLRQTPKSFRYRDGSEASAAASKPRPMDGTTFDPLREINLVSIVFEGMGPESRARGTQMMQQFLDTPMAPNTWVAVFTLNHRLSVVQPYTTDLALLRKGVTRAGTGTYQEFAKENVDIAKRLNSLQAGSGTSVSNNGPPGTDQSAAATFRSIQPGSAEERGPEAGDAALNAILIHFNQQLMATLTRQEGSRTIDALRILIRQQAQLPGRKTVLYVSEGLTVPPEQPELLESVISEANRANVSFYTVDARGLITFSSTQVAMMTTNAIRTAEQGGANVQQSDLQQNARQLAQGTGGAAMDNSNDLRAPLERVMEDVRSHYEVTFSPPDTTYDGRFRKLDVKVLRAGVTVQGRRGYFALPVVAGETLAPFEVAALNALNTTPAPQAFPYHAAALRFGAGPDGSEYEIAFSIPNRELKLTADEAAKLFNLHVSFVGVIKDEQGEIVQVVRRDLPYRGPLDKRAEFSAGEVTATAAVRLKPGRYRLEAIALDREAGSASVRKSVLVVPPPNALAMSDFIWVRSVAPVPDRNEADPLESTQGRITPELNPSFSASGPAPFYFLAWSPSKPIAAITVARDGKILAKLLPDVPNADDTGAYSFTGQIPLTGLAPGQYELTTTLSAGQTTTRTRTLFNIR